MMIKIDPECQTDPFSEIDITLDWHKTANKKEEKLNLILT